MKDKPLFTEDFACHAFVHCHRCRSKEANRWWRKSLTIAFRLPDDNLDFECPFGAGWESMGPKEWWIFRRVLPRPGNVLRKVLAWMGYKEENGCNCQSYRHDMNRWGWWNSMKRWRKVVGWLKEEHKRRKQVT